MKALSERAGAFEAALDRFLERRSGLAARTARYGWLALALLAALLLAGGATFAGGRSQQVVYATEGGSVVALEPEGGTVTPLYEGDAGHYATGVGRTGGSRSIAFTVLREDGGELRGSLYSADLVRETRALLQNAAPGEVLAYPDFAPDRAWVMASRFAAGSPPNVAVLTGSSATSRLLEPDPPAGPAVLGPTWTSEKALYAWRTGPDGMALTAYDFFERRQAAVYETDERVGPASYYFDANALLFAERPRGAGPEESRIRLLVGTGEMDVSGAGGLGLYDPSPPVTFLDGRISVMWTDRKQTGVGLVDPDGWAFEKTGIAVEEGSRNPRISTDGRYLATTDASGTVLTVRRMDDGDVVRRVEGVQPAEETLRRMRAAGMDVPEEAGWLAPANFGWRSFEDA
jgi:hypothetical protein